MTKRIVSIVLIGLLAACTNGQTSSQTEPGRFEQAYEQFVAYLDKCSAIHETDPRSAIGVGENELVVREREWRSCAYDGIRSLLMPASSRPELYAELIAEDQAMTDKVDRGQMTRTQRRARLDKIREEIATVEERATNVTPSQGTRNAVLLRQIPGLP